MARSALHPRRRARHRAMLGGVLAAGTLVGAAGVVPDAEAFTLNKKDAQFALDQILVAENGSTIGIGANQILDVNTPRGLRTVAGSNNNVVNATQGAAPSAPPTCPFHGCSGPTAGATTHSAGRPSSPTRSRARSAT